MSTNAMEDLRKYPHSDIKIFDGKGNLKKIIPIEEAMETSSKELKKKKPFGFYQKKTKEK